MNARVLNSYSENLPVHKMSVISGSSSINRSYIACESGEAREFSKRNICELKLLQGNKPANYLIARESTENYDVPKLPDRGLAPRSAGYLSELSDSALVSGLEDLRGKERKLQLKLLLYLIEIEKRKLYLPRGYNSLFEFCTRHLKYSASAAMRRINASRCIKKFPIISKMLLDEEINLTSISKIAKIITKENCRNLLKEIRNISTRNVERIVARHCPRDSYYDTIKPIFLITNKKRDSDRETTGLKERESGKKVTTGAGSRMPDLPSETTAGLNLSCGDKDKPEDSDRPILEEKFKLQFAVDPEFMRKLKQIKSLLSTKYPNGVNLEKVFSTLMEEYLERHNPEKRIEKRKNREANKQKKRQECRRKITKEGENNNNKIPKTNKQRSRNIPAAVRDKVYKRDGGRCAFVAKNGKRCDSTWNLEIDHIVPFARGGNNSPGNLRLLCAKHNLMEAERAYGKDFIKKFYKRE